MTAPMKDQNNAADARKRAKEVAASCAADLVDDGMVLGLGSGSTAALFVQALGRRVRLGLQVVGVPTSELTAQLARMQGIPLATLETYARLDLDVDGADAIDPDLNLLKGLGGALLREKIVASASDRFVAIVDDSKLVASLAQTSLVPVEVTSFGWTHVMAELVGLGASAVRRTRDDAPSEPFITDGGNFILDCRFGDLSEPASTAARIKSLTGVVDHGLFIGLATEAIVGSADGSVRVLHA